MLLTILDEKGAMHRLNVGDDESVENIKAILEAEVRSTHAC
jgi:hypothetical protein